MSAVSDLNILKNVPLPAPDKMIAEIPPTESQKDFLTLSREAIRNIIFGDDHRFLLVVGPCSIHDRKAGMDYARRLAELAKKVEDRMFLVMRVYFEKPRTTVGWKGLIMDPNLDETNDIPAGLRLARTILREVLDLGVPTATELLDPITPQFIADLISWSAIGARTTESQTHRQMASGLSMPLGFKNGTPGTIAPAINAIKAATQPQTFLGVSHDGVASAVSTRGNPHCHLILRGGDNGPNYSEKDVADAVKALAAAKVPEAVMVDCSHANCDKDHEKQPAVFREVVRQRPANSKLIGAMVESNINAGNQKFPQPKENLAYGVSITDKCINWETTEQLILEAYENLAELS